jgi:hypothetical protein
MAVINGIHNIAVYLQVSEPTVRKYIKKYGLPIRKLFDAPSAPVMSTSDLLDRWVEDVLCNPKKQ